MYKEGKTEINMCTKTKTVAVLEHGPKCPYIRYSTTKRKQKKAYDLYCNDDVVSLFFKVKKEKAQEPRNFSP
jgi:hypothetical protein